MKSGISKFLVGVVSLVLVWGTGGIAFADNAAEVNVQVSYPSGNNYVVYYNGVVGDIDASRKDYYINVHVTLLDANGLPATAGPSGEEISTLTATLTSKRGVAGSIAENVFLSDSATLQFDMVDVGSAARAHVRYACQRNVPPGNVCELGTDTLTVTVGSLTGSEDVTVRAPDAHSIVVRTPYTPGSGPVELFEPLAPPLHNAELAALAGDDIYFEVWAYEENGDFTFAPNLEGKNVNIEAYADYDGDSWIDNAMGLTGLYEMNPIATTTAKFEGGKATGHIQIKQGGNMCWGALTFEGGRYDIDSPHVNALRVAFAAGTGVKNVDDINLQTSQLWQFFPPGYAYEIGTNIAWEETEVSRNQVMGGNCPYNYYGLLVKACSTDWVSVKPGIKSKLIIGEEIYGGNLIEEIDNWYVLDDEASGPTRNDMAVFVTDTYCNPVTGEIITVNSVISDNLLAVGVTDTPNGWDISKSTRSDDANDGLEAGGGGADNASLPSGGGTIEGTLTLSDAGGLLASDDATVHLVRWATISPYEWKMGGKYIYPDQVDLRLFPDHSSSGATINAGDTVTLYITSASCTSPDYPTTSEIVEEGDNLVIRAIRCGAAPWGASPAESYMKYWGGAYGETVRISGVDETYEDGVYYYEVKAPKPEPVTGEIQIPIKIYEECVNRGNLPGMVISLGLPEKGIRPKLFVNAWKMPSYFPFSFETSVIGDVVPDAESKVRITYLPAGMETDGGLGKDPIVITSPFGVGENGLLIPTSVDTTDDYNNLYNGVPAYGISSEIGVATVDDTRGASVTYDEDDIGQTDTVTVSVSGVGTRQLQIVNIVESLTATALECTREGPVVALNAGEAILWVKANGNTAVNRDIKISIDTDNSVLDAELRDMDGVSMGNSSVLSLVAGSPDNHVVRLVVSAPAAGNVVVEASDATSGVTDLLDTCTTTIRFSELEKEPPTADISPADGSTVMPTSVVVITVEDNFAVNLAKTQYSVEKDGSDITGSLACKQEGDGTPEATITCRKIFDAAYSWGDMAAGNTGLEEGSYVVKTTPQDLMGNPGTEATSSFTVASCEPSVTISPATADLEPGETQEFSASTSCDGSSPAGTYSWDIMTQGCTGSTIDSNGLYTAPATISGTSCNDTVRVTDTANGNATATAEVTVGITTTTTTTTPELTVSPDTVRRSRWVVLPTVMVLQSDTANFTILQSKVTYSPANAVIKMPRLVLGPHSIWQLVLVNPPWLAGGATDDTLTVTVTTGTEEVSGTTAIQMLPIGLDK